MKTFDAYGFKKVPRETVAGIVADALGVHFEDHDSLYWGDCKVATVGAETFRVFSNYNVFENEWFENENRDCAVLLYIEATERADEIRQRLMERLPTITPLRREQYA